MNEIDRKLLEGLRELAADGPREAPAPLEGKLLGEFRNRARVRRRNVWLSFGSVTIAAGLLVALVRPDVAPRAPAAAPVEIAADDVDSADLDFYPLPDADALPPLESATIVRVELPMSSLRLMGVPVLEDNAADVVEADMLLGQDGLARGVRLVD